MIERDRRMVWIGVGVVLIVLALAPVGHSFAGFDGPRQFGPGAESGAWRHGAAFGGPMVFGIWALIIGGIILLSRNEPGLARTDRPLPPRSAEDLLRWRYAAGEIGREQFEEMSRVIGRQPASELQPEQREGSAPTPPPPTAQEA